MQQLVVFAPGVGFDAGPECQVQAQMELPPALVSNFQSAAQLAGVPLAKLLAQAMQDKIIFGTGPCRDETAIRANVGKHDLCRMAEDLNKSVLASDVLLELILNRLDHEEHRLGTDFTREERDNWNYGLSILADGARAKLKAARASARWQHEKHNPSPP
jgi:hypothetical protein